MRYIAIEKLQKGMIVGRNIYDSEDRNLLAEGRVLNEDTIDRLVRLGYPGIYITDDLSKDIQIQEAITKELRNHAVESLQNLDVDNAMLAAENIVRQIIETEIITLDLVDLRTFDDYTFRHSVNVAVISCVIAMGMGYSHRKMVDLCVAAIFHDLGKMLVDKKVLNKPGKLNAMEIEIVRNHAKLSYDLICEKWNISQRVKQGVLSHHENEDGSGYPRGLMGDKIHPFAKIIHVVDVYDALSSRRPYKGACSFSEALEYLMGGCGTLFEKKVVEAFMNYVSIYPKGITVILSDKREAVVVKNHRHNKLRPKLRLMDGTILDLGEQNNNLNITIVGQADIHTMSTENIEENEKGRVCQKYHIMVVDDKPQDLSMIKRCLDSSFQVSIVKYGKQALELLNRTTPDVILMEVGFPNHNGIERIKRMQSRFPHQIPVILMSVQADSQTVLACGNIVAADYIVKPFEKHYLQERIQAVLGLDNP